MRHSSPVCSEWAGLQKPLVAKYPTWGHVWHWDLLVRSQTLQVGIAGCLTCIQSLANLKWLLCDYFNCSFMETNCYLTAITDFCDSQDELTIGETEKRQVTSTCKWSLVQQPLQLQRHRMQAPRSEFLGGRRTLDIFSIYNYQSYLKQLHYSVLIDRSWIYCVILLALRNVFIQNSSAH